MSICSYCYKSQITPKHDVSSWWNNTEGLVFVCSDDCKDKLDDLNIKIGKFEERVKKLEKRNSGGGRF